MLAVVSLLLSWSTGWAVTRLLVNTYAWKPVWLRWTFDLSLGWAIGAAVSSVLFFASVLLNAPVYVVPALEIGILAVCLFRMRPRQPTQEDCPAFAWNWFLRIAAGTTLCILLLDFAAMTGCMPDGGWDAQFIWNIRGKFLAGGPDTWRGAVTGSVHGMRVGVDHPDYPALVPSVLARAWSLGKEFSSATPIVCSLLYSLTLAGLLGASLAWIASETIALVAMIALLGCELFTSWSAAQYADIPLALYALASLVLLAAARHVGWPARLLMCSGAMAGSAAWTKNEGIALLPCMLLVALLYGGRRAFMRVTVGMVPFALLTVVFKLLVASGTGSVFPQTVGEALDKIAQFDRWELVLRSFALNFAGVSAWWAHPALLLGGAAVAFGLTTPTERLLQWRLLFAPIGLLAVDLLVFLTTRADLAWNLDTAADRLVLQVLPSLLFLFSLGLRPPGAIGAVPSSRTANRAARSRQPGKKN